MHLLQLLKIMHCSYIKRMGNYERKNYQNVTLADVLFSKNQQWVFLQKEVANIILPEREKLLKKQEKEC